MFNEPEPERFNEPEPQGAAKTDDARPDKLPPSPGPGAQPPAMTPAMARFYSCRWHKAAEGSTASHCTHRDVLPLAGMTGFSAESWCDGCEYYKLRRVVRRPSYA
jgi:hypothetical protein